VAVFQANQQAKAMGKSYGPGFERQLKKQVLARVDWRVILQEFVSQATRSDYAWMHPNPRYITQGIYLPGLYAQTMGTLVVALDTSGSVSQDQLTQFAAEISAILETYDTTLEVIYADRKVRGQETFTRSDLPLTLKPRGGGGDRFPKSPPGYPVLWVNTETFRWDDPPFGTVIDMETTEAT
jgi:predicted metal-dependent peptidase